MKNDKEPQFAPLKPISQDLLNERDRMRAAVPPLGLTPEQLGSSSRTCHPDVSCPNCDVPLVTEHAHSTCPKCHYKDSCCF